MMKLEVFVPLRIHHLFPFTCFPPTLIISQPSSPLAALPRNIPRTVAPPPISKGDRVHHCSASSSSSRLQRPLISLLLLLLRWWWWRRCVPLCFESRGTRSAGVRKKWG